MSLQLVEITEDYSNYLYSFDHNVKIEHPNTRQRKFLGVLFTINDFSYYAPLSSPKIRHDTIKTGALDIYKINTIKKGEVTEKLGVIDFSAMIPIPANAADYVIKFFDIDTVIEDEKYINLLKKQIRIIRANREKIIKKAEKLYRERYKEHFAESLKRRCCDFKLLEEKSIEFTRFE